MSHCSIWKTKLKQLKDTLKVFGDFKNKEKGVWSNVFDKQQDIYSESVFNTLYSEIKHKY